MILYIIILAALYLFAKPKFTSAQYMLSLAEQITDVLPVKNEIRRVVGEAYRDAQCYLLDIDQNAPFEQQIAFIHKTRANIGRIYADIKLLTSGVCEMDETASFDNLIKARETLRDIYCSLYPGTTRMISASIPELVVKINKLK